MVEYDGQRGPDDTRCSEDNGSDLENSARRQTFQGPIVVSGGLDESRKGQKPDEER